MPGYLSWTFLLPFPVTLWFVLRTANACARMGGLWRMVGVFVSLVVGILCIGLGRYLACGYIIPGSVNYPNTADTSPAVGYLAMAGGALIAIFGTWAAFVRWERKDGH